MTSTGEYFNVSLMKPTNRPEIDKEKNLKVVQVNPNMAGAALTQRQILLDAGFSPVIVKKAVKQLDKALDADKVRVKMSNGVVVGSVKQEDWDNRLKACNLVFNLAGVSRQDGDSNKLSTVNVQVINYAAPDKERAT